MYVASNAFMDDRCYDRKHIGRGPVRGKACGETEFTLEVRLVALPTTTQSEWLCATPDTTLHNLSLAHRNQNAYQVCTMAVTIAKSKGMEAKG